MTQAHAMKWALGYRHLLAELGYSDMVDGPWKVVGDNAQAGLCDLLECMRLCNASGKQQLHRWSCTVRLEIATPSSMVYSYAGALGRSNAIQFVDGWWQPD
jgi:hypothetical protein